MVDQRNLRRGIWRSRPVGGLEAYAYVVDVNGKSGMPLDESLYRDREYEPPFDELPTQEEYEAAQNA